MFITKLFYGKTPVKIEINRKYIGHQNKKNQKKIFSI